MSVARIVPAGADSVAVIGENRKMLVFKLDELPELGRGSGVQLQRYRDGGLSDVMAFALADGISWPLGGESGRVRSETDLTPWRAIRGASGRIAPNGFPRSNRFEAVPIVPKAGD
jgi:topoisomerase-4 subunit A